MYTDEQVKQLINVISKGIIEIGSLKEAEQAFEPFSSEVQQYALSCVQAAKMTAQLKSILNS